MGQLWSPPRLAVLRRVAAEGGSFSDAARELGLTRSAIAGKAHREGIRFACPHRASPVHGGGGPRNAVEGANAAHAAPPR